jgi:N-acetylated-alpha-linked acidic dipeptidase
MYDNHNWVANIGDPGFRYHVTMVQFWGVLAMRLAESDVVPLDYAPYATTIRTFLDELERRWTPRDRRALDDARQAAAELGTAAAAANEARRAALEAGDGARIAALNRDIIGTERGFLHPAGIPGRPWYKHLIYAPKHTYAPELLPGVAEAIDARANDEEVTGQLRVLAAAIRQAAASLGSSSAIRPR